MRGRSGSLTGLYFFALLALGVGYLAILPPFEGFDETAHLSSIREIAATGAPPAYGKSRMDALVDAYAGPTPYPAPGTPIAGAPSYASFFADPAFAAEFVARHRAPRAGAEPYAPGEWLNWQAQHPPLYYAVLVPFEYATRGMSLVAQLFVLRSLSYLMAIGGVWFAFAAARMHAPDDARAHTIGFLAYPLVLPMFFPEFARLGNDSLCLLLAGIAAWLYAKLRLFPARRRWPVLLGLALGLGALTKAFFLPMTAAILVHFGISTARATGFRPARRWIDPALVACVFAAVGGFWYVRNWFLFGDAVGGNDALVLAAQGGIAANLAGGFPVIEFLRGFASVFMSWSWAGTWSLIRPPLWFHVPLLLFTLWLSAVWMSALRKRPIDDPAWIAVWLVLLFGAGLAHHIVVMLALIGKGGTPGWYLHVLMPWTAPALGLALRAAWGRESLRPLVAAGLGYAALFHVVVAWSYPALYAGCVADHQGNRFAFIEAMSCLGSASTIVERLSVLAWPNLAIAGFALGAAASAALAVAVARGAR